jgi:ribokinase
MSLRTTSGAVCVLGSFMMDLAIRAARRPAPGETIVGTGFDMFLGGKGFNQAIAAARAGARTAMIGRVGADDFGRRFLDRLGEEAIDHGHVVVDPDAGTGIGAPLIDASGENSIVIVPRANQMVTVADVERAAAAILAADVLLLQLELPFDTVAAAARIARQGDTLVLLNPAPAPSEAQIDELRGLVDLVVPNEVEVRALSGPDSPPSPSEAATALSCRLDVPVVVTVGGRGCVAASDGSSFELPAHPVRVVDTVGAGDAFCGALGAWLSAGADLRQAVVHANAAGALAVTRPGAEPAMPARHAIVELAGRSEPPIAFTATPDDTFVTS